MQQEKEVIRQATVSSRYTDRETDRQTGRGTDKRQRRQADSVDRLDMSQQVELPQRERQRERRDGGVGIHKIRMNVFNAKLITLRTKKQAPPGQAKHVL